MVRCYRFSKCLSQSLTAHSFTLLLDLLIGKGKNFQGSILEGDFVLLVTLSY